MSDPSRYSPPAKSDIPAECLPYVRLAEGVVLQAVDDYRRARSSMRRGSRFVLIDGSFVHASAVAKEVETFFVTCGDLFKNTECLPYIWRKLQADEDRKDKEAAHG